MASLNVRCSCVNDNVMINTVQTMFWEIISHTHDYSLDEFDNLMTNGVRQCGSGLYVSAASYDSVVYE